MICPSQAATIGFDLCPPCFADMGGQFIYHLFLNKTQYLGSTFLYGLLARISDKALPAGVDRSCVCNHPKNWQTGHIPNCKTIIGFYISCFNFTPNGYFFLFQNSQFLRFSPACYCQQKLANCWLFCCFPCCMTTC